MIAQYPKQIDPLELRYAIMQRSDMAAAGDFSTTVSGTGAAVNFSPIAATAGRYGIANLATGTTTTGRAAINTPSATQIVFGSGVTIFCASFLTPSSLSDATNRYTVSCGFSDTVASANLTNGCTLRYRDNLNSGKWQLFSGSGGLGTQSTDTGITVAASTWYRFEIIVNAAGTAAQAWINGTLVGTATTLPLGATEPTGTIGLIIKSAGTTARSFDLDYMEFRQEVDR